jgi:hypothetical protein
MDALGGVKRSGFGVFEWGFGDNGVLHVAFYGAIRGELRGKAGQLTLIPHGLKNRTAISI